MELTDWQPLDGSYAPFVTHITWVQYEDEDYDEGVGSVLLRTTADYPTFRYDGIEKEGYERLTSAIGTEKEKAAFESLIRDEPTGRSTEFVPSWLEPPVLQCGTCENETEQKFVTPTATICRACGTVHYHEPKECPVCGNHRLQGDVCRVCNDK